MKRYIKYFIFVLCFSMLINMTIYAAGSIDSYKNKNSDIKKEIDNHKKELEQNQKNANKLKTNMKEMDDQLQILVKNIENLQEQINKKEQDIERTQKEILDAKEKEQSQYESLKKRIKYMYEYGQTNYLEVLFKSKSLPDLFNRIEYIKAIMKYDKNIFLRLKSTKEQIEQKASKIEQTKAELETIKSQENKQWVAVRISREKKNVELASIQSDQEKIKKDIEGLKQEQKQIDNIIKKLQEEAKRKKFEGGELAWPVPGWYGISSLYGWRNDPFNGKRWFHKGIDIPATRGSKVVAAESGKVIFAGWLGGYGYAVMINHHNGFVTLYGHNSKLVVKKGQEVKRGQKISEIGTTGRSTGPHCHFGVKINNKYTNPIEYLGKR